MNITEVDAVVGNDLVSSGALLLDVRNLDEWEAGHAPGATLIPLPQIRERLAELPRDRRIVAICRVGGRSAKATEFLCSQGLDVVNLAGGMLAWTEALLPVVSDAGGGGAVI